MEQNPLPKAMQLVRIKIDENRQEQVIILKELEGRRYLPMVIGMAEVNAIKMKLGGINAPRPLTHDLLLEVARNLGGRLERVMIDRIEENTFFATLVFKQGDGEVTVDSRPSDGIALALRAEAPIYCAEEVLELSGVEE